MKSILTNENGLLPIPATLALLEVIDSIDFGNADDQEGAADVLHRLAELLFEDTAWVKKCMRMDTVKLIAISINEIMGDSATLAARMREQAMKGKQPKKGGE